MDVLYEDDATLGHSALLAQSTYHGRSYTSRSGNEAHVSENTGT